MPTPLLFSYSLKDEFGVPASCDVFITIADEDVPTVADLRAAAISLGTLLDAVTGLFIDGYSAQVRGSNDAAWKAAAVAGADPEQTLLENFNLAGTTYSYSWDLPGLRNTLIDADGKPIIATGAIDALNDALIGTIATGMSMVNQFGIDPIALNDASISFRKLSRKKRKAVSTVTP